MVVDTERTDRVFRALADATRRDILLRVMRGESSVSTLASYYPMSFAAVQKHVVVLERARLVTKRKQGREQLVLGESSAIEHAIEQLERYEIEWRERLVRFDEVLQNSLKGRKQ
ncbi:MAG: regulatory protein ArsR [Acidimicrobiaceae bacterium]|nr:regulatory protein ArsR [Acidimicrobiaceae bacterium]